MNLEKEIIKRSEDKCEFCSSNQELSLFTVEPKKGDKIEDLLHLCNVCIDQIQTKNYDKNHWRFLNDTMWSELDALKVMSYRVLSDMSTEPWAGDLLEMFYMEEEVESWAKEGIVSSHKIKHIDANGVELNAGDSVVLIKDLKVKGANFTAKRGTAVRNISLDMDNEKYIEGKVDGQKIVIITDYVKK